jgi:hypothetical protein
MHRISIFNTVDLDNKALPQDKIEVECSLTTHYKTVRPKSFLNYIFNVQTITQDDSTIRSSNYCSSSDDFEKIIKTITLALSEHSNDAITHFLITAKGNLNEEYINLRWNNLNDFCEFLQNKGLINNRVLRPIIG